MSTTSNIDIDRLDAQQKLELIAKLWDSLADEEVPLTDEQRAELDARLATYEQDRADAVSWDELKKGILEHR